MTTAYPPAPQNDDLQGEQVQCMYSQAHPSQQCKIVIEKHDLEWAQILRQTLGVCPPRSPTFRHILEEYSRTYLCRHHRQEIDVNYNEYWQERLDQWTEDLKQRLQTEPRLRTDFAESRELVSMAPESSYKGVQKHRPTSSAPTSPHPAKHSPSSRSDLHRRNKSDPNSKTLHRQVADTASPPSIPFFSMYKTPEGVAASTFEDVVTSPLTIAESKSGYIYAYRRITGDAQDQQYIRIGHSSQRLDDRVQLWSQQCQYFLELVCPTVKVSNAARVEALVHKELELSMKRRVDVRCKMDSRRCQTMHDNWFEIEVPEAESVIQYWSAWMESQNPYDNNGNLRAELHRSIHELRRPPVPIPGAIHSPTAFNVDSKGRLWHNVRLKSLSPLSSAAVSTPELRATQSGSSKKRSRRNKPAIPQRKSSLNLGSRVYSTSVPHLPLPPSQSRDLPMPSPRIPRRKTSVDLRAKYNDQHVVPLPSHLPTRSRSLASFKAQSQIPTHSRFTSIDTAVRSSSSPPTTKSLRRRHRNSSLRGLVSVQSLVATAPSSDPTVMEATIVRREKCRSIYIGAPTVKKVSIMKDLSQNQIERS